MRAPLYAFLLPAWALLVASLAGCLAAPEAEDWLAVGFQTPEQTFRTFQTGLRAELPDLEYRCLGTDFKHRMGASLLGYLQVRREQPWLKFAAKAEVKEVRELGDGRVRLVAEVDTWFHDEAFALDLVREDFWELWVGGKRVDDDAAVWRRLAREKDGNVVVTVPLPEGLGVAEIGELRAGREWKIDGFSRLDGSADGAP